MCKLRRKLIVFDLLVEKWAEWQGEILQAANGQQPDINECLQEFDSTRFMKLLYFTCLESYSDVIQGVRKKNLFDLFDEFVAYPNGPVEVDVYSNRSILPRYTFKEGKLKVKNIFSAKGRDTKEGKKLLWEMLAIYPHLRKNKDSDEPKEKVFDSKDTLSNELIESESQIKDSGYVEMANKAIERLKTKVPSFCFEDSKRLIDISHELVLWKQANVTNNKLATDSPQLLQKEFEHYREQFPLVN